MAFSNKDKAFIKNLYQFKKYGLQSILTKIFEDKLQKRIGHFTKRFGKCEAPTKSMRLQTETRA